MTDVSRTAALLLQGAQAQASRPGCQGGMAPRLGLVGGRTFCVLCSPVGSTCERETGATPTQSSEQEQNSYPFRMLHDSSQCTLCAGSHRDSPRINLPRFID